MLLHFSGRNVGSCLTIAAILAAMPALSAAQEAAKPAESAAAAKPAPVPVVAVISIKGDLSELPAPMGLEGSPVGSTLRTILERLEKAKTDPAVRAVVLKIRPLSIGWGKVGELRAAIKDVRAAGKRVVAQLDQAGNSDYLVAAAADEIVIAPAGTLQLGGLASEVTLYKNLFEKFHVKADFLQVGDFKGAAEPYTRSELSPEYRKQLTEVLQDQYDQLIEAVAARQGIAQAEARSLIDGGPYTPEGAKRVGLVNRVAYPDEVEGLLKESLSLAEVKVDEKFGQPKRESATGLAGLLRMMQPPDRAGARSSKTPRIAVIHASGTIDVGKSASSSLLGGGTVGSDTLVEEIEKADRDEAVKAIVLRVDSPGGSALASDLIWRAVVNCKKPIVASMSDLAASGGYYISMGCDQVWAEPGTITGSIGVVGGKVALGGAMEQFGVTTDVVSVGKNGTLDSPFRAWSPEERDAMKRMMEETYRQFVGKAAEGRKKDFQSLEALAGGKIYTGRQAKALGLVDELGTLNQALAAARKLAGVGEDTKLEVEHLPKPGSVLDSLFGPLEDRVAAPGVATEMLTSAVPAPLARAALKVEQLRRLLERERVLVMLPFDLQTP